MFLVNGNTTLMMTKESMKELFDTTIWPLLPWNRR